MGGIIRFERPITSSAVLASLVALGYLQQANRHRDSAIKRAIDRLRSARAAPSPARGAEIVEQLIERRGLAPRGPPSAVVSAKLMGLQWN